jgi:hypothetical protein
LVLIIQQWVAKLHSMYRITLTDHGLAPSFDFSMALDGFD